MNIFLYEHVTGGGLLGERLDAGARASLEREGDAMLQSLAADFAAIDGLHVRTMRDAAAPVWEVDRATVDVAAVFDGGQANTTFDRLAGSADWTLVVAPEIDGALLERVRRVERLGGRLLGPASEFVALASDKRATVQQLAAAEVAVPDGRLASELGADAEGLSCPVVVKPRDGAGSVGVRVLDDVAVWRANCAGLDDRWLVESLCNGVAVSVAALCGPAGVVCLSPCQQRLSDDGRFRYLGGATPLSGELAIRAGRLARRALAALPQATGWVGVDLVLGAAAEGEDDRVIEVNPRLTTSYVGLRAAARTNLAASMLDCANGVLPQVEFRDEPIEFYPDGRVVRSTSAARPQAEATV